MGRGAEAAASGLLLEAFSEPLRLDPWHGRPVLLLGTSAPWWGWDCSLQLTLVGREPGAAGAAAAPSPAGADHRLPVRLPVGSRSTERGAAQLTFSWWVRSQLLRNPVKAAASLAAAESSFYSWCHRVFLEG